MSPSKRHPTPYADDLAAVLAFRRPLRAHRDALREPHPFLEHLVREAAAYCRLGDDCAALAADFCDLIERYLETHAPAGCAGAA